MPETSAPSNTLKIADAHPEFVTESGAELKLILGEFAGPLDLLLYLIRQEKIDIYDLPIARITTEYLRYLQLMKDLDISVAGDFLVMAATLIEIKAKMLLPPPPPDELPADTEEDPRDALVRQLLEHQKYKSAAQMLWSRATVEQAVFRRGKIETDGQTPEVSAGVFDLLNIFQSILARRVQDIELLIAREEISLGEMLARLRTWLRREGEVNLRLFFEQTQTRRELVVTFMAVLEMVKAAEIVLRQSQTFGDIIARARRAEDAA